MDNTIATILSIIVLIVGIIVGSSIYGYKGKRVPHKTTDYTITEITDSRYRYTIYQSQSYAIVLDKQEMTALERAADKMEKQQRNK